MNRVAKPDPAFQRRLIVVAVIEAVFITLGCVMYLRTYQLPWMLGPVFIGTVPVLWVLLTQIQKQRSAGSAPSIVEDARERR